MNNKYDRRDFLKRSACIGAGLALGSISSSGCANQLTSQPPEIKAPPIDTVRMGFVGVGGMGSVHVRNFLNIENVQIRAVCDIVPEKVARVQKWVQEAGQPEPAGYSRGETDFKRMCENEDIDLVFNATPWRWHVPVCVAAMENAKHAATEVPAAVTLDECWQLVETSERTRKYCVMMENCCYDRTELMILNMVRKGLLGELLHAQGGYLHDLRDLKFSSSGEGLWRTAHSIKRNGDLYPTHGLGPVAQCMNVNRGNRFDYLVSMSCNSRGLNLLASKKFGPDSPQAKQKYALGDVVTTLIRTVKGQTIVITHDTNTPRPYSRNILVQGTKGIVRKYPEKKIHIEGKSEPHTWEPLENYAAEYEHPLWKAHAQKAEGGHGGMDYIEDYRLIQALRTGTPTDMDVYDAAAWSVVSELTERSIANRGRSVDFPDFTRGKWKTNTPLGVIEG
ncbi:MAG: Gfo/Idh/MocA family protein [Planctomycetota bacterium]|jgi:predicted dehydrogenase